MSNTAPAQIDVTSDITYKDDLALDVYGQSHNDAAIVLLHGGGWFHGDKAKDADLATRLAEDGYLVFVPNYELTPAHPFPGGRDDVLDAIAWVKDSEYAFYRDKLAVSGTSAGGNLAVEAALATGRPAVSWSGPLDLQGFIEETDGTPAADAPTQDFSQISSADINQDGRNDPFLRWVILGLVGQDRSQLPAATTVKRASAEGGPVYLANSIGEFVPPGDAMRMQRELCAVGVESIVQLIPGTLHAKGYTDSAIGGSLAFLERVLNVG
jgi:acetyl esterase